MSHVCRDAKLLRWGRRRGGNTDFRKLKYIAELGSGDSLLSQQVADSIQTSS